MFLLDMLATSSRFNVTKAITFLGKAATKTDFVGVNFSRVKLKAEQKGSTSRQRAMLSNEENEPSRRHGLQAVPSVKPAGCHCGL